MDSLVINTYSYKVKIMSELFKFLSLSNPSELCSDHFPASFADQVVSIRIILFD